ncbi:MAG: helix-turn-helix transcriptional regulator [Ruminococcus sp.]|nr:helix-turn-helix transcriptional regulator [Ruminococcus sp.]
MKVKLRSLLTQKGLTQAELAQATGIRPSTISQLCNNVAVSFKFSHLELICKVLKCNLKDILEL